MVNSCPSHRPLNAAIIWLILVHLIEAPTFSVLPDNPPVSLTDDFWSFQLFDHMEFVNAGGKPEIDAVKPPSSK